MAAAARCGNRGQMKYKTGRSKSRVALVTIVLTCSGCQTYTQPSDEYDSMDVRALEEIAEARRDYGDPMPQNSAYGVTDPRALEEKRALDEAKLPICAGPNFLMDGSNRTDAEQQEAAYNDYREMQIRNGICRRN